MNPMIVFIVNPAAGNGRGAKVWREMEVVLKHRSILYCVSFTSYPGHAGEIAAKLFNHQDTMPEIIVAVGGDGTVNEVVNGVYQAGESKCKFGYIPAGSGNDYARGRGIPPNPLEALDLLLYGTNPSSLDLLQIGNRVAANSIGCGFDGQVAKTANQSAYKNLLNRVGLGKLSYVLSLIIVVSTYRPNTATLIVDGEEHQFSKIWLICAANIPYYGGGMMICPKAVPDDGMAEVCVISGISRWKLLLLFPLVYSGKHATHPAVRFYTGQSIEILPSSPLVVHTDGEVLNGNIPLKIQVLSNRLQVIGNE